MFIGPVFTREATIAPRRLKTYVMRMAYALALLVLMSTGWLVLTGTQLVRDVGDLARFGMALFQILAPLQLALATFFAALLAATQVAHEKDRRTLVLLLLTRISNSELVLGKLLAALLNVFVMIAAGLPVFFLLALLGGISHGQIARTTAVTVATVLAAGSLGSLLALWREKTFQALALTVLVLVLWLSLGELAAAGVFGERIFGLPCQVAAIGLSPWQAILEASRPYVQMQPSLGPLATSVRLFLVVSAAIVVVLNGFAVAMVRVWNPSRTDEGPRVGEEGGEQNRSASSATARSASPSSTRRVWDNPIVWREIRTWAYGRRILVLRIAYLALFALAAGSLWRLGVAGGAASGSAAWVLAPLVLLSLVLVNAQAVTSLTSERDAKALDLLLVTDLTPKEVVYGKLGGIFYNTKEMVLLPILLCVALWMRGTFGFENLLYILGGLVALYAFAAMLGLHVGMTYANSGVAIATSLGTVFFLFVGVAVCMRMMMAFSGSFGSQFLPFFAFMVFGGVGLYAALGVRNPSPAIGVASFLCPIATFYAITSCLLDSPLAAFLAVVAAYGFTVCAMLIPAVYEFDVATGRTTTEE